MSEFRIIGQSVPRHDAWDKVAARTRYAAEWSMPGMLHSKIKRSAHPSARLVRVDTSKAEALPGVVAVLTAKDVPNNTLWTDVPGQTTAVGRLRSAMNVLADGRVRFQGEPIALVAAETEEIAQAAVDLIEVEYELLPGVYEQKKALEPGAPPVHESGNALSSWRIRRGDMEKGFAEADVIVEREYRTSWQEHAYLEPDAGVAWIDADGVLCIRYATQVIEHYRGVAKVLGLPENKVRTIGTYVGGGFGGREDVILELYIGLLAMHTGRPVKMVWSREEAIMARTKRHPYWMRYKTGAKKTGEITAQEVELISDSGAYAYLSPLVLMYSTVNACGPYDVPNVKVDATSAYTNNVPSSAFRGFGAPQPCFAYESQMDEVARALGMDPAEFRAKNWLKQGEMFAVGQKAETYIALPECTEKALELLGPTPAPSAPHCKVGRGIACEMGAYGRIVWLKDWSSAWAGFETDGSLTIRCGVPDVGGGQAASLCQIASEVLGVPLGRISVHISDSALTPLAGTTTASRQLSMSGNAILKASRELFELMAPVAAQVLGTEVSDLATADGFVYVKSQPERRLSHADWVSACARAGVPRGQLSVYQTPGGEPWSEETGQGQVFRDFTYGTHAAYVEVDTETGRLKVLKYVAVHDVGQCINQQSVEGQIHGASVQGLGYAIWENLVIEEGYSKAIDFHTYLVPTVKDLPDVEAGVLEVSPGVGPFGARGIGEPPILPPPAVISNAICDATGVRVSEQPFTPERVLRCLRGAGK
ncbi:MAG TPA: xanthine dehydrogenase family protein molybdopterin-binding subunit [Symbiobacteriaceae bacterium]|nr:xanthine dehydrogenase family protein molybdopterin-binding subunit [Symbiobacteriaceae bacterium]